MSKHPIAFALPAVLLAGVIAVGHAAAQSPAGAFAGKTVNLIIGFGTSGGYDLWARVVARHIGRHLPGNPTVTPQNMEGAGSYRAANFIYNVAPIVGVPRAVWDVGSRPPPAPTPPIRPLDFQQGPSSSSQTKLYDTARGGGRGRDVCRWPSRAGPV
jgi:hypothetical protein